jgi:hypothetical protein
MQNRELAVIMEKLTSHAPIQVREDTTEKHERIFPLLISESIDRTRESLSGLILPRFDMWNTYGLKTETQFENSSDNERERYIGRLIMDRYSILTDFYGINSERRTVVRDDDSEIENITLIEVRRMIDQGTMVLLDSKFTKCEQCNRIIAPSYAKIIVCNNCTSQDMSVVARRGLFITIPDQIKPWIVKGSRSSGRGAVSMIRSAVNNLPTMIQASKQRRFGVSLTEFGLEPDFVLDPIISLALIRKIALEMGVGDIDQVILGRDAIKRFVPYMIIMGDGGGVKYTVNGLIPPYSSKDDFEQERGFHFPYLSNYMSGFTGDVDQTKLCTLRGQYSRVERKYNSVISICDKLTYEYLYPEDDRKIEGVFEGVYKALNDGDVRLATVQFRDVLFNYISKVYINECKRRFTSPNLRLINELKDLYRILYGL